MCSRKGEVAWLDLRLGRQRAFKQFQVLRHHRVAVFRGDVDAGGTDGTAIVDATEFVQRLGEGKIGGGVGRFHRDALLKRLGRFLEVRIFHISLPQSKPCHVVVRINNEDFLQGFNSRVGH